MGFIKYFPSRFPVQGLLVGAFLLAGCAASKSSMGTELKPSIYYKPRIHMTENRCESSRLRTMMAPDGGILTSLCEEDLRNCLLQGSCRVDSLEGAVSYNYHSTKEGVPRFIRVDDVACPFGYGARNICLDPFFSVAADLQVHSLGEVFFIPRLVGAVLPSGEIHDGYVVVRDAGGAIQGAGRFDFFTGFLDHKQNENTLAKLGFGDPKSRFQYRAATFEETALIHKKRNYPGLKETP